MNLKEKASIIHYHRHRIEEFQEETVKALGWKAAQSQQNRFEVLMGLGDFNGNSILDVGCGYGDLKSFLDDRFSDFTYIGIDQIPEFIAEANHQYEACPNTFFHQADFSNIEFPKVDYVIASGALGYKSENKSFYKEMIQKLFTTSKKGFGFNMLDNAHFQDHPLLTGHDRSEIFAFCKSICLQSKLIDGYLTDDFTILMFKE